MTGESDASVVERPALDAFDKKKVVVKQFPWDDKTFPSDLPHIMRQLLWFKGRLEMHSHNLGTGEFEKRSLTNDELDCLYLDDERGLAVLDKT